MIDDKNITRLDAYLDNKLSEEEKNLLLQELKENAALNELLELLKISRESIELGGLKNQIQSVQKEYLKIRATQVVKIKPSTWWIGVAASISLFILIGNFWIQKLPSQLIEDNYISYEISTMRSSEIPLSVLENDFKNKAWTSILSAVPQNSENQSEVFLAGIAAYELGDFESAIEYLERVIQLNQDLSDRYFHDEAEYYLSLSLLKLEKYDNALVLFEKINLDENHIYHGIFTNSDLLKLKVLTWVKN
ncbi:tetratricopeptide repeat protein [Belliella aquatica]|uniref:Tetratricopeptide repeat protein n=1 Tax=Belliella aquatica TaxID=1323734 RepID=A0ABQ1M020_9BACT|nr:tetratricopeptide repeat protein [Belliella aquatica]MCH7406876.1 tetratricopeptide repeat protein [Belliella aquatica]GGC32021.1 hypothetical protein GCM10010993_08760 [Belliella aquatica]